MISDSMIRKLVTYLAIILLASALCSCGSKRTMQRTDYREEVKMEYNGRTSIVSLDSLQRWLTGRLLVTEVHLNQPDSTGAQSIAKVVKKELDFAGGEDQSQEVKSESVEVAKSSEDIVNKEEKETKKNQWPVIAYFGLLVSVLFLIFVEVKQLKNR